VVCEGLLFPRELCSSQGRGLYTKRWLSGKQLQGRPSHGRNEAGIFIIAIFWGIKENCILGGKEILVHERLGDVFRGKLTSEFFADEKKFWGRNVTRKSVTGEIFLDSLTFFFEIEGNASLSKGGWAPPFN